MASDQVPREKATIEKEAVIEKDKVPKMTTHFESLTESAKDSDIAGGKETPHEFESLSGPMAREKEAEARKGREEDEEKMRGQGPYSVGKFEVGGEEVRRGDEGREKMEGHEEKGRSKGIRGKEETHKEKQSSGEMKGEREGAPKQEQYSLEEIGQLRGQAQESSMEALKAAEERYNQTKEEARRKLGTVTEYATEKGSLAKDTVAQGAEKAKDTFYSTGQTAKDYTAEKAEQAKEYAVEKATEAKEASVDTTKKVGERAAGAKEVTVQTGKGAAEYAGKLAEDVKDKAVVAGWTTAHYTTEKAVEGTAAVAKAAGYTTEKVVEGTKAAVRAVEGVAEYAGHKAAEIVSKPLVAAKDAAASTGESMKEYTGRKKEEAKRDMEAKRGERQGTERSHTSGEDTVEEVARPITSAIQEPFRGGGREGGGGGGEQEKRTTEYKEDQSPTGGLLQAIGETVVEIAQETKDLVIGEGETREQRDSGCVV